ncbi:type II toxin-antitoxin system HicB family antitoxin [Andreprevotia chitinilytica]|uniref:type II toxin-antitoxin system HicB family antitoxin n=1 Tax=Andreprevotia chitinilytica TaxID=396808 RepID=UPI00054F38F2|nr:type II toxin-antitoxin system HicB family antitoxin [Andreprevotia chitinilytica]
MHYPIAIEPGDETHAFGVTVPDLPGCFSAGDTLDEAIANAREAIDLHLEGLAEDEATIPQAGTIASHYAKPEFAGYVWGVVEIDISRYLGKAEKINVTLPGRLIRRIDALTTNRSGWLAEAALEKLQHH